VASRLSRSFGSSVNQTTTPEVYDRYLAARQLLRDRREVTLKEADRLLREAIRLDPNYAPAYAELSQVLILRSDHPTSYGTLPFRQARAEAETLARKAIALDPNLGDAYAALGFLYLYDKRATPYYQKAVALSPQRSEYHRWLAQSLWLLNRYDEAIAEYRRAIEIDPLWGINYEHLTGQLHFIGRDAEANEVARRFLALSSDQRGKLQLLRSMANDESRAADNLRYARALYAAYPQERIMKFWLASPLSLLGENRQAAQLMASDPTAHAALTGNWPQLARLTEGLGRDYWERATLWNTEKLLVASGRSDVVVRLYDQAVPFIRSGALDPSLVMTPDTVLALRIVGRNADANSVLASAEKASAKLPPRGVGHIQRELDLIAFAALKGRNDEALSRLGALTRTNAVAVGSLPAMSLTNNPILAGVKNDPRLLVSDERIRLAVNAERAKANLPPISREAWISDPKSLLTKN
jgi:tetratricopeptide (TPR) repeat protein